ncbi:MAG TPA: hypothetical protein VJ547_00400 [Candidatus Thermoplasmatota archaeon]|nr:hypothetical protein [Candidatus Thermoplasmatota archaeon]
MKNFVYLYIGGEMPKNAAEGKKVMAAWEAWFREIGDSVVDMGAPFGERKSIGAPGASKATGYTVVKAADLKAAVALAQNCPVGNGTLEVLETMPQM